MRPDREVAVDAAMAYVSDPAELTDEVSLLDSGIVDSTGMLEVILFLEGEYAFHILLVKKPTPWSRRTYTVTRAHDDDSVRARRPCKQPNEPPGGMKVAHSQFRDRS
jgi:hypothetical protein